MLVMVVPSPSQTSASTTNLNIPSELALRLGLVQRIGPVPPTGGAEQSHPAGAEIEWNRVPTGVSWATVTLTAGSEPVFSTRIVDP